MPRATSSPRIDRNEAASLAGREFGLSSMLGNLLVLFLEGLEAVMPPGYSAGMRKQTLRKRHTAPCPYPIPREMVLFVSGY